MVGKNNKQVLREKHANKFKRYALKKLTVGLASVTIGTGLAFATSSSVSADELAVGERTVVVSDKTAEEQPQPDTPYLQEQEEAVTSVEEPQVTEDRISEEKAVKESAETEEKATESEEVAEEKQADSHEQTEEASDKEETNTKAPQAPATQFAPVAESVAEPVRQEQPAEAPTTTLSQIDQLPEEFLTYLRDHSDIVDFKNAATIETYSNLLQQSYGVEAAKEERIRAIEAAVKEIETTKEQAKNEVVDQTERLIDADNNDNERHLQAFTEAIHNSTDVKQTVEDYLQEVGYDQEVIAHILDNVDMTKTNNPKDLLKNIIQTGLQYAKNHQKPHVLPTIRNADGNFNLYGSGVKFDYEVNGPYRSDLVFGTSTLNENKDSHGAAVLNDSISFEKDFTIELEIKHENEPPNEGAIGLGMMFIKEMDRKKFEEKGGILQGTGIENAIGLRVVTGNDPSNNIGRNLRTDRGFIQFVKTGDDGRTQVIKNQTNGFQFANRENKQIIKLSYKASTRTLSAQDITNEKRPIDYGSIKINAHDLQMIEPNARRRGDITDSYKFVIHSTTPKGRSSNAGPVVTVKTIDYKFDRHTLKGKVYLDENNNKKLDNNERGLEGVRVNLRPNNYRNEIIKSTLTAPGGNYEFTDLAPGDYFTEFVLPEDKTITNIGSYDIGTYTNKNGKKAAGMIPEVWHDYTLNAGMRQLDAPTYTIGDKVWLDSNGNGIQDEESGVENVEVTLVDEFGDVKGKTKTDQNGNYRFTNINRGNYQLVFNVPKGYSVTKSYQGDSRVLDSNSHISYLRITPENPNFSNNNNYTDLTHDLGLIQDVEYERTVEETPFKTIYQFDGSLNPGEIKLTTEGRNGREEVLYKHLPSIPANANSISPNNFSEFRNKYWEEISREKIQEKRDAVVKYNFDAIVNAESEGDNYVFTTSTGRRISVPKTAPNQSFEIKDDGNLYVTINGQEQNLGKVKGEKGDKGEDGADGHTPEIGENGNWIINGVDTEKPARGADGKSVTVDRTETDGDGNTVVHFSDGSQATIAKGEKGDKGEDGADGHTPEIGENGNWIINGVDTEKPARGADGKSVTVDRTETDGDGNTIVHFSDGSQATIAKGEKGDKGEDGADGHTPEIGENGNWIINGVDTEKPARGEKGESITVTRTETDGDGNTIVHFSDGSQATIAKGEKGDKGEDGADGHTPEIGENGNWIINGVDTEKPARGEKGESITVTRTEQDEAGNTVVHFSDGSQATIAKGEKGDKGEDGADGHTPEIGENGNWIINGVDTEKPARGEKGESITVTRTETDGDGNTIVHFSDGSQATIAKGEKGDKGDNGHTPEIGENGNWFINGVDTEKPARGADGKSVTVDRTETDGDGNTIVHFSDGSQATIAKGEKGDKGEDGADGHTPEIGENGNWIINGVDTEKPARGEKGESITVTRTEQDEAGNTVVHFSDGSQATIAKGEKGDKGEDGADGHTPEIGENGNWIINGVDTEKPARGEKGESITVTRTETDGDGNTIVHFSDGSQATIAKGEKGDKGEDGADGHTPEIGENGNWIINGVDTEKPARGEKGESITVTRTEQDEAGNTVVHFSDGSQATIAKGEKGDKGEDGADGHTPEIGENGNWIINGVDTEKPARGADGKSVTVDRTETDGDGNTIVHFSDGSQATIAKGEKGDKGEDGADGHTPEIGENGNWIINGVDTEKPARGEKGESITVTRTEQDEAGNTVVHFSDGSQATIAKGEKGDKGDNGHTPEIGENGNWIINGVDTEKPARGADGKSVTVDRTETDGDGNTIVHFSDGSQATIAKGEKGDKGEDGADGHTPEIGENGNWIINGVDTEKPARGEKGESITVTRTETDGDGNTIVHFSDGSQATIAKGEKGDKGDNGHTPEIGENGNWFINGVDTEKPARGADGKSVTVDRTETDGDGNTIVHFSDGSQATIAKGEKGDKGEDGADGHTPEIGENGNWIINGVDTEKPARGEKGESITVTRTEQDEAGNTVVHFSDGSQATIAKGEKGDKGEDGADGHTPEIGENGNWIINGVDTEKPARGEKGESITVTRTETDGDGNTIVHFSDGSQATIAKGEKGDKGEDGADGHTPEIGENGNWIINGVDTEKPARGEKGESITVTRTETDGDGNTIVHFSDGSQATIAKGEKGDKGDNGHTPEIGENGNWFINGVDTEKPARGADGKSVTVDRTETDGDGNTIVHFSDGSQATIAKGEKGDKGEDGADGHTPEIGENGNWIINGVDTEKPARGEKGESITVTRTEQDEAGNTVVHFSDGSQATIAKGEKGDKGEDGADGHTPEIGENGNWIINGVDTEKPARGEKGESITVTRTETDGDGNTIVHFSDGSQATIAKGEKGDKGEDGADGHTPEIGENGNWIINGVDTEKPARGEKGESITVTRTETDGDGNTIVHFSDGSQATIAKGEKGDKGDNGHTPEIGENGNWFINGVDTEKPARGADGKSVTVDRTETDGDGNTIVHFSDGSQATIAKGEKGDKGEDGADGHTPEIGENGNWIINGVDTEKPARGEKGESITVTRTEQDEAGNTVVHFSDGSQATIAKGEKGDKGEDGADGHTPEIGENGNWIINGVDTEKPARGADGKSVTVDRTETDGDGNTIVHFSDGSQATIAKGEKGDKGEDGADGHTPEIGENGNWIINGVDTEKPARGEKGESITVTRTEQDEAGNTVVHFSDGSQATIAKGEKGDKGEDGADGHTPEIGENGNWIINGVDTEKPARGEKGESITVTRTETDGDGNTIVHFSDGSQATIAKGEKGDKGEDGADGHTPEIGENGNWIINGVDTEKPARGEKGESITVTRTETDGDGNTIVHFSDGSQATIAKGEKGDKGDNGHTPEIGENGNWFINGVDTEKPARGADGKSVTVDRTETDGDGNTIVHFSDGSQATIAKGEKGDKGEDGADGHTPEIGENGNWIINGVDTEKPARGEKGESITVTRTEQDEAGNTVVHFSDGSQATIAKGEKGDKGEDGADGHTPEIGENGNWIINGVDTEKPARGADGKSVTVDRTETDGDGNTIVHFSDGSQATIAKGEKGDKGEDGADGHTPEIGENGNWIINGVDTEKPARGEKGESITVTRTEQDEAGNTVVHFSDGSQATIAKGEKGDKGEDGADGHTPEIGENGNWIINGVDTEKPARGADGKSVTVDRTETDGDGNTIVHFSDGSQATIAKGEKGDKGEDGADGHTPEIGENGNWIINGVDTEKPARGEKGESITVTRTEQDEAGNTVVHFSDGSQATIAKGEKGDKGDNGHTPEIGENGNWIINGVDTEKPARGADGKSVTVDRTETDGDGNTIVHFSDGSQATIAKGEKGDKGEDGADGHTPEIGENGNWIINGVDTEKPARGEKGESITVTRTETDGDGNTIVHFSDGSQATIAKGEKGDKGDNGHTPEIGENGNWFINGVDTEKPARGADGKSVTVDRTETDGDGNTIVHFSDGSQATIAKGEKGDKGEDGADGHTPEIGENGNWIINGVDTEKPARGEKGESITVTRTETDGDGNTIVHFSDGSQATIAKGEKGDKGDNGHTPEIGENGNWFINGVDTEKPARGADGKSVTVDRTETDGDGNTIVHFSDGSQATIAKGEKGDKGEDGADGHTPEIGENGNWIINGVDTEKPARGADGKSVTVDRTETDGDGNTIVHFSDGSQATIAKGEKGDKGEDGADGHTPEIGENGNWIINGVDTEKPARGEKGESITVTRTETDGDGNTIVHFSDGSQATIAKGEKGDKGEDGADGHTPEIGENGNWIINGVDTEKPARGADGKSVTVDRTETDGDGNTVVHFSDGSKVTIAKGEKGDKGDRGEKGEPGKDGNSVTASVERGEQNGRPGTYVIIRNEDGTEIDREFIFDGENGQTPTIESSNVLDSDGQTVGTRIIIRDGNGRIVGDQIIRNGKDGQNGKDGETPTIGSNGNWFIAGKDTGVKAKGEDGQSITITKETRDADGNTIVYFSDGSTVTISKGDKGDQGQKGDKGERGQTPNVSQTPIRDQNGRVIGYTLTFTDPVTGEKIGNSIDVYNGTDGKDGKSVTASVERGEQNGRPGSYIIIRNEDGVELDREFVFDGEDGTTPKVAVQTIERNDGRKTHVVTITNPKTGETQTFTVTDGEKGETGRDGKDGRDGRDGRDGKDGFTPTIGSNGNWFIAGQDTGVKAKGEDGQSITVTKEMKDEQGNTVVHFSDGSTITISKGDKGETGPAGKDGRDGRDGKDGKDLTGNNGNINIENSNNQSQNQNQTQNQNSNQVVTNNTYNFGDVSLTINQTLNLNGEVVLTKVIVKDKDGLTNETQIDKNTQINHLNVFVNNGQVLVGTFNLTNQNNVKQLLVGNLIINLVINNDSADNPTVPKKPEQPETTPERPSETPEVPNTPEETPETPGQPSETPNVPSTPEETPGTPGQPGETPEQPNETPNVPSTPEETPGTPGQPGETPEQPNETPEVPNTPEETPGTPGQPGETPEQPNETPNVPSTPEETPGTPGQPGETPKQPNETPNVPNTPEETPGTPGQPGETPEQPNETPDVPSVPEETPGTPGQPGETPEQPNETPNVPSTPEETPGTPDKPGETPEQPNETPNVPSTPEETPGTPGQPGDTPEQPNETPGTPGQPGETPEQPNETPNVPSTPEETPGTPGQPGETPEQPNETPNVPSTPEETPGTPGQPGETPEQPNETPDVPSVPEEMPGTPGQPGETPEQPNETPNVPSTPEETPGTPGQPGETPEQPSETPEVPMQVGNEGKTPNTPTQLSNTPAQPDRSSITGEQLPETATDSWMLALASLVSLSSGAVLAVKKKKDDE